MSKLFQIKEEDLASIEQALPELADALMTSLDNRLRTKIRLLKRIITDVRWNYGPPSEVEIISADSDPG